MDLVVAPTVLLLSIQMARFLHLCWQTCAFSKQILWRSTDIQLTTVKHQDHVSPLPKHRFPNFDFASHESGLPAVVACLAAHYKVRPFNANVRRRCLQGCVCTAVTSMPAALRTLQRPLDEVDMGLISGDARGSGLRHLMRISQLVLACAVQSDRRDDYIAVVLDLPEAAQEILMQLVSDVMPAESDSGPVAEATSSTAVVTPLSPRGGGLQKRARASVLSSAGRHHPIASPMSPSSETEGKRTRVSSTPSGPMDKIRPPQHVATSPQFTHRQLERENEILQEEVVRTV